MYYHYNNRKDYILLKQYNIMVFKKGQTPLGGEQNY